MKFLCLTWSHLSTGRKKYVMPSDTRSCKLSKEEMGEKCDFKTEEENSKCDVDSIPWMFSVCDVKNIQWNRLCSTDWIAFAIQHLWKLFILCQDEPHNATLKLISVVSLHVEGVVYYSVLILSGLFTSKENHTRR